MTIMTTIMRRWSQQLQQPFASPIEANRPATETHPLCMSGVIAITCSRSGQRAKLVK